jgi:hypothetical protein
MVLGGFLIAMAAFFTFSSLLVPRTGQPRQPLTRPTVVISVLVASLFAGVCLWAGLALLHLASA